MSSLNSYDWLSIKFSTSVRVFDIFKANCKVPWNRSRSLNGSIGLVTTYCQTNRVGVLQLIYLFV